MSASDTPRPYEEWRVSNVDRAEDAAYTFGYHLIHHCRREALKRALDKCVLPVSNEELEAQITSAVDTALHNVMDLLEGFWPTKAGPNHQVSYALSVCVSDTDREQVERIDISPALLDLPIGYWKFKDGEFR